MTPAKSNISRMYRIEVVKNSNGKEDEFYPQVSETNAFKEWLAYWFADIRIWERIGVLNNQEFRLYSYLQYPCSTKEEALRIIVDYKSYLKNKRSSSIINVE